MPPTEVAAVIREILQAADPQQAADHLVRATEHSHLHGPASGH